MKPQQDAKVPDVVLKTRMFSIRKSQAYPFGRLRPAPSKAEGAGFERSLSRARDPALRELKPRPRENRVRNIMVIKSNYGRFGGAETVLSSILKRLDRKRFHLTFIKLTHDSDYKLSALPEGAALGIDERVVRWKNYFSVLDAVRKIRESIADSDIDVIYTHDMRADLIGYAMTRLQRIPWVAHIHGWLGQTACVKTRFHEWVDRKLITRATVVLSSSEHLRCTIQANCSCRAIEVVPNYVDPDRLTLSQTQVKAIRQSTLGGMPNNAGIIIGTVGRLHRGKGHQILLRALAQLRHDDPSFKCLIVGEGPYQNNLRRLSRQLRIEDSVVFAGYHENVTGYVGAMDLFVMCSFTESLPMALLEAMLLGKPVVATDVGDVRKVLDSGKAGILIKPGRVDDVVRAVKILIQQPQLRQQLAEAGKRRVLSDYSVQHAVREIESVLLSACSR